MSQHSKKTTQRKGPSKNVPKVKPSGPKIEAATADTKKNTKPPTLELISTPEITQIASNLIITDNPNRKFNKREISSNWDRYAEPVDDVYEAGVEEEKAADFQTLLEMPSSRGGHFQFKNEKFDNFKIENSTYFKYFRSKPSFVAAGLASIPFYERCGLDKSLFTPTDLRIMNHRATLETRKFSALVHNEREELQRLRFEECNNQAHGDRNVIKKYDETNHETRRHNEEKDSELTTEPNKTTAEPVDLDKWLDDLLDS